MHATRQNANANGIAGELTISVHDLDDVREDVDDWDDLGKYERWLVLRDPDDVDVDALGYDAHGLDRERAEELLARSPPDAEVEETTNTTVDGLHEYIVDNLDPAQARNEDCSHLAVGTDDTAPSTADSSLGAEVYRTEITDVIDNGKDLTTSTFLDSTEANGNTLAEVGLFTDTSANNGTMLNRATITKIVKDDTKTATIDVELQFRAA